MSKPKIAFYWCASCGGCEEAVVDLGPDILTVVEAADIVFWPVALDFKRSDVEKLTDGELAVSFVNGAVRTSEQREMAELMRRKSGIIIAFGSCAHLGGIPGLANTFNRQALVDEVYKRSPSVVNDESIFPQERTTVSEGELTLPALWDTVKTLDQVIKVDYYLPGCPPPRELIKDAVGKIVSNQLPEPGTVLAPDVALCQECRHRETKPDKMTLKEFKRPHMVKVDPDKCLLVQGLLCLGPITRKGCGAACVSANMPCTGCLGPTSHVMDFGTKALASIASMADSNDEKEIAEILSRIVDPLGTFYRYSLPASLLHRNRQLSARGGDQS
jgi:F420-non-reducing hydrogenase small subunit